MNEIYTQHTLNEFFEEFKNLPNSFKIEQVHLLLNNPNAKATHKVNSHFKHLKFIIMTSAFIIGVSTLFLWVVPKSSNTEITLESLSEKLITDVQKEVSPNIESDNKLYVTDSNKLNKHDAKSKNLKKDKTILASNNKQSKKVETKPKQSVNKNMIKSSICIWPTDTIIDKEFLLLELSDDELNQIGVVRKGREIFYHNIVKGYYDFAMYPNNDSIPEEEKITTYNEYFIASTTNNYFEPKGPGLWFYKSMDTLVPVLSGNQAGEIFWFTPHPTFFKCLPIRYSYLQDIYENLKCLKSTYPERSFTNYLSTGGKPILESVNLLHLKKQDLKSIGIVIDNNSITFQSKNKKLNIKITSNGSSFLMGNDSDFNKFPPNPFPVTITDTLGRRIFVRNTIIDKDSLSQIMNILVPVRINLNEVIPPNQDVIICWYYPSEDFLNSLPYEIGNELKSEVEIITENNQSSTKSCTYYEVCKSTLQLENFKLYPNPASYSVTIEFNVKEEVGGSISIVNIAGARLKTLVPNSTFLSGHNSYQMDLSGITPGIYLISINTDKGFKTQRLIVSQ